MVASRVLYSLSADGLGTQKATIVNKKGTPAGATILTWALTSFLIIVGQFELLLSLVTLFFMAMYVGLVIGVFKLRRQEPDAERPFRSMGISGNGRDLCRRLDRCCPVCCGNEPGFNSVRHNV